MREPSTVSTRTCAFTLDEGYLVARFHAGAEVTVEDAHANLEVTGQLGGWRRVLVLVDLRLLKSQTPEARALLAGPVAARVSAAVALLIGSPLSRVLGNFYLRFNRPETPTRLFSSEEEARAWLLQVGGEARPPEGRHAAP
jgi:hypothetical protein